MNPSPDRFIVVSNRLPIVLKRREDGNWDVSSGAGGLVSAMDPVLRKRGGVWIGWPGTTDHDPQLRNRMDTLTRDVGYNLRPVMLTAQELEHFYYGYSNEVIWPLFHDLQSLCNFEPHYWQAYEEVNRKFAEEVAENANQNDFIWIHDYQLMTVGAELRERGIDYKLSFFLHIPFPPFDIYVKLPERHKLLHALLKYDLIGFQTRRDQRNFVQCVRSLFKQARVRSEGGMARIDFEGREVRCGVFPIGIDHEQFEKRTMSEDVARGAWYIHEKLPDTQIVLGVDRLDYTKGIPHRLRAFRYLLERHPELHGKLILIQVVVPSRTDIPKYHALKVEIEQLVGEINGQFTASGWVPIHYIFRSLNQNELLSYYRTCEIALITPLKDGMNLVSKEFCACSLENNAVLVLSQFAGAAPQLARGALLVNPNDIEAVAEALNIAYHMPREERRSRMNRLRRNIRQQNIFWWVDSFMRAAVAKDLRNFPVLEEYIPEYELEMLTETTKELP